MTWNIEIAIEKENQTMAQIETIITSLESYGFKISQYNVRPYIIIS